ncbi:holothin acyltransferase-like [Lineus longissimus]|uniref:holothin acyltransferase-like n=1 Tax=Lineus longissimus TaxID=88925 RepID=UPI002B4DC652
MSYHSKFDLRTKVVVRQSTERSEWEELVRLANAENWNETISDHEVYFNFDPKGIFVALVDGKPVGFTAAINWSDDFAVGGLSIVNKQYRGRGIGHALWEERLKHVGDRNFMIFSAPNRIEANKRLGFTAEICRFQMMSGKVNKAKYLSRTENDYNVIVPYEEGHFDGVLAYDNLIHYINPRDRFLRLWFAHKNKSRVAVAMAADQVVGYGCIYPTYEGYRIGPLYADSGDIAAGLLRELLDTIPEPQPTITMAVFSDSAGFKLAKELNLSCQTPYETAMCRREIQFRTDKIYAVFDTQLTFV